MTELIDSLCNIPFRYDFQQIAVRWAACWYLQHRENKRLEFGSRSITEDWLMLLAP